MGNKRTLWQRIMGKGVAEPTAAPKYNPLGAKAFSPILIDLSGYTGKQLIVKQTREVIRSINATEHKFADYDIEDESNNKLRLRVFPEGKILILDLYEDMQFSDDLWQICLNETEFHVTDNDNNVEETYWRIGDVKTTQECMVLLDVGSDYCKGYKMDYWDFSRITKDEANQDYEQYLFVEMDKDSGRFQMWRGQEINQSRITVL